MDPLLLLRRAVIAEIPIELKDEFYIFESYRFHENTVTRFKRSLKGEYKL